MPERKTLIAQALSYLWPLALTFDSSAGPVLCYLFVLHDMLPLLYYDDDQSISNFKMLLLCCCGDGRGEARW
jgi:condensin-2 complex subunit G2